MERIQENGRTADLHAAREREQRTFVLCIVLIALPILALLIYIIDSATDSGLGRSALEVFYLLSLFLPTVYWFLAVGKRRSRADILLLVSAALLVSFAVAGFVVVKRILSRFDSIMLTATPLSYIRMRAWLHILHALLTLWLWMGLRRGRSVPVKQCAATLVLLAVLYPIAYSACRNPFEGARSVFVFAYAPIVDVTLALLFALIAFCPPQRTKLPERLAQLASSAKHFAENEIQRIRIAEDEEEREGFYADNDHGTEARPKADNGANSALDAYKSRMEQRTKKVADSGFSALDEYKSRVNRNQ